VHNYSSAHIAKQTFFLSLKVWKENKMENTDIKTTPHINKGTEDIQT